MVKHRSIFKRKQPVQEKVFFSITRWNGWQLYIKKHSEAEQSSMPSIPHVPKPDVTVSYTQESDVEYSFVTIYFDGASITMKAPRRSDETKMVGNRLKGYDESNRRVVEFNEMDNSIYVALNGMNHSYIASEAKRFIFDGSPDSITFRYNNQIIMEWNPVFVVGYPGKMEIKGWINESFREYLPYLAGLLGYVYLT